MLRNYFKIARRNISKHKLISLINICGLSAGIAFTLIIAGYIWQELRVNADLKDLENQYILQSRWKDPNMGFEIGTPAPLARQLSEQYPDLVANYYRFDGLTSVVSNGSKAFRETMQVGDSTLLNMYGLKLLHGDRKNALDGPYKMLITEKMAVKYFGQQNAVGKTLSIQNFSGGKHDFMITGVLDGSVENSVTQLDANNKNQFILSSFSNTFFGRDLENWANQNIVGYLQLKPGVKPADLAKPMKLLIDRNTNAQTSANMRAELVPLKTYHLTVNNGLVKKMLYTLGSIALFILLMAVVNFINMSISQSAGRMKEIGIRKVVGGLKKQLIFQFLTESVLIVLLATLVASFAYLFLRGFFSDILGRDLPGLNEFPLVALGASFATVFLVGLGAGIYPAFVLSSLRSVDVLKGKLKTAAGNNLLRKVLVGFQFCTAIFVFAGALVIARQVNLFFSNDLGYNKEYVVSAQVPRDWTQAGAIKMAGVRDQLAALPDVHNVVLSYEIPNGQTGGIANVYSASADSTKAVSAQTLVGDEHYVETYSIPLVAGSFFHASGATDSLNVVINTHQAQVLGYKDPAKAIGAQIRMQGTPAAYTITGVTRDFHFASMKDKIQPIVFLHVRYFPFYRYFSFRLKPGHIQESLGTIQKKWASLMPGAPFEYNFMDDTLARLYKTELQLRKASLTATVLSFIIVFLGVLGLISISVQKRVKEIGIRKVLGSS
ncbi:MAG: ABC transporter permease, partial [Mucilaginibacter polytrichastri]|nr:ABC transporter permease [Mucilaginibacter polytrichastri]